MKVVLYRNKKNMEFSRIEILSNVQVEYLNKQTDLLKKFNDNSEIEHATIIDIDNEEFPKDALKCILTNTSRIELIDIYEKLKQLEDDIYLLTTAIANVREDLEDKL